MMTLSLVAVSDRANGAPPGNQVPGDRTHERTEDDAPVDDVGGDEAGANSLGHVETKEQEGDEVEERRPNAEKAEDRAAGAPANLTPGCFCPV
jgi:hypothetical protein